MKKFVFYFVLVLMSFSTKSIAQNCFISELFYEIVECDQDVFTISINFEYDGVDTFYIAGNGTQYGGFSVSNLPILLDMDINCDLDYEFVVTDYTGDCSSFVEIGFLECCSPYDTCTLSDFQYVSMACNDTLQEFMFFDVNHEGMNGDFVLYQDGNIIGTFSYQELPLQLPYNPGNYLLCDNTNPNCCIELFVESEFYSEIDLLECDGETYYIEATFSSEVYEEFTVIKDGNVVGTGVSNQGLFLGPFSIQDNSATFQLTYGETCILEHTINFEDCIPIENCIDESDCNWQNLSFKKHPCQTDGTFYVEMYSIQDSDYNYTFSVLGNGNHYGNYHIQNLPVFLGPYCADCETNWSFIAQHTESPGCFQTYELGEVCCDPTECDISDVEFFDIECVSSHQLSLSLNFNYDNMPSDSFNVVTFVNGEEFTWTFNYDALPVTIPDFIGNGTENQTVYLCDALNESCINTILLEIPDCSEFDCMITGLNYNIVGAENETFTFLLYDVYVANPDYIGEIQLELTQLGYSHIFSLDDLPLSIGPFDCVEDYLNIHVGAGAQFEECAIDIINWMNQCGSNLISAPNGISAFIPLGMDILVIESKRTDNSPINIDLYDSSGKLLKNYKEVYINNERTEVKLPRLPGGLFYANITSDDKTIPIKFITQY